MDMKNLHEQQYYAILEINIGAINCLTKSKQNPPFHLDNLIVKAKSHRAINTMAFLVIQ